MKHYTKTDQHLHWICQIIAKANRTFVPKKEDDSHTNLYFDSLGNRIVGRWVNTINGDILFTLNLANQQIEIVDSSNQIIASVKTISCNIKDVEKNIEELLPTLGLNADGFSADLHFEIPNYEFAKEAIPAIDETALNEWKYIRKIANEACMLLLGHLQASEEIRIWPHHFDTGLYTVLPNNIGLGFGFAMEDEMAGAPYYYMSGYPISGSINYENLPSGKGWKWELGEDWKGAILPMNQLETQSELEQKRMLNDFLIATVNWFIKQ